MSETPGIGHNRPPDPIEALHAKLMIDHRELTSRRDDLALAFDRLPAKIEDDETAGKVGDYVRLLQTLHKNAEAARQSAKAPFLALAAAVDGFFAKITDPCKTLIKKLEPRRAAFLAEKEARARREAEEEAARLREQAARDAKIAEEKAEEARKAQEERDRIRREEEAAFARAAEEAERAAKNAREAAEAKRRQDAEAAEKAEREAAEAKRKADEALAEARRKSEAEAEASRKADEKIRDAEKAEDKLERAATVERVAAKLERVAAGESAAPLARTRGDYGSVSTINRRWVGELVDRKKLNLEALRPFLAADALEAAINGFVRAGGRDLEGARIFETDVVQTR